MWEFLSIFCGFYLLIQLKLVVYHSKKIVTWVISNFLKLDWLLTRYCYINENAILRKILLCRWRPKFAVLNKLSFIQKLGQILFLYALSYFAIWANPIVTIQAYLVIKYASIVIIWLTALWANKWIYLGLHKMLRF